MAKIEISFAILAAFYPEGVSSTNANAFIRDLAQYAGGAINSAPLETVVVANFPGEVVTTTTGTSDVDEEYSGPSVIDGDGPEDV